MAELIKPAQLLLTFRWRSNINQALIYLHGKGYHIKDEHPRIYINDEHVTVGSVIELAESLKKQEHVQAMQIKTLTCANDMAIKRRIEV